MLVGVMGSSRMRTPTALYTALATAAASSSVSQRTQHPRNSSGSSRAPLVSAAISDHNQSDLFSVSLVSRWFWGLPLLLVLAGLSMNVSNTPANSFLQGNANPRLRGQTVSLYMLAMRGGLSLGSLVTGTAVSIFGIRWALLS